MHIRCPHCNNPVDVVDDNPRTLLTCPSCGSSFSLLGTAESLPPTRLTRQTIGRFELLDQVGMGQFGMVWKARDTELDRVVAVKIPRRGQLNGGEAEQFLREARAAAQLKHPHIVSTHEVGREDESIYIVSDFVQGANLSEWLSGQRLTVREAAELCSTIATALHHAHEAGVIHRDLKPSNIMMDLEGQPHVMDFGLAKREAGEITMTRDGQVLGTPAYMSPEQAVGKSHTADRRSDIYSLGVILFELLTGERPFRGDERMLVVQILTTEAPSPRKLNSRIPKDLETICLKCLEKDPNKRYATSQAVSDDLQRSLDGKPIHARPISRTARGWRWCKRQPVVTALVASILVSLLSGGMISTAFALRSAKNANAEAKARQLAERELNRAEWLLYARQIALAQDCWEFDDSKNAWARLDDTRSNFRGWEHRYLCAFFNSHQTTFHAQTGVLSVAFSPDGNRIVSGCEDHTLKVWDASSGQETLTLKGHAAAVNSVAYSPDGKRIVSGSDDNTLKVWDASSGQEVLTLKGHKYVVDSVAYSPDGKRIVSGSADKTIKVWDASSGQEMFTLKGHAGYVTSVAYSPDGSRIVSASWDETLKVWDASSGREMFTLKGHTNFVMSVAYSPNGKRIVSGSVDETLKVWDASSGQEVLTLKGNNAPVAGVSFSPDGSRIVSASWGYTLKVWDASSGQETLKLKGHKDSLTSIAFSPNGNRIVSGSFDGTLKLWDPSIGQVTPTLKGHADSVTSVAYSPDSKWIASGSDDKTLKVWGALSGREALTLKGHTDYVYCVAYSPDGKWIVSGSRDKTLKVWDALSGQELLALKGHQSGVRSVAFSPDSKRIVSGSSDNTLKVWDASSGHEIATLEGHTSRVLSVAFGPDAKQIISGSVDATLRVWNTSSGQETLTLKGQKMSVESVAFSPDGNRIVSGSGDGTLKVWDASLPGDNEQT